jgi:hypothetical protein
MRDSVIARIVDLERQEFIRRHARKVWTDDESPFGASLPAGRLLYTNIVGVPLDGPCQEMSGAHHALIVPNERSTVCRRMRII